MTTEISEQRVDKEEAQGSESSKRVGVGDEDIVAVHGRQYTPVVGPHVLTGISRVGKASRVSSGNFSVLSIGMFLAAQRTRRWYTNKPQASDRTNHAQWRFESVVTPNLSC